MTVFQMLRFTPDRSASPEVWKYIWPIAGWGERTVSDLTNDRKARKARKCVDIYESSAGIESLLVIGLDYMSHRLPQLFAFRLPAKTVLILNQGIGYYF